MNSIINGKTYQLSEADMDKKLMDFLREDLDLTGTKNGCDIGSCGACTVIIDAKAVRACIKKVKDIVDKEVITIEGMEHADGSLSPLQEAFVQYGAIQCGFCTPGMVLSAHALLLSNNEPSREEIRKAIKPNLCRCTGYKQIVDAIEAAAVSYR